MGAAFSLPNVLPLRLDVSTEQHGVYVRNFTSTVFGKSTEVTPSYTECSKETQEDFLLYLFWYKPFYLNPEGIVKLIRRVHQRKVLKQRIQDTVWIVTEGKATSNKLVCFKGICRAA